MEAMYKGLIMDKEEKRRRATNLMANVEREDISHWLCRQMEELAGLV